MSGKKKKKQKPKNMYLSYDLITFLGIYPIEMKTCSHKNLYMSVQSSFTCISQRTKCPSADECTSMKENTI